MEKLRSEKNQLQTDQDEIERRVPITDLEEIEIQTREILLARIEKLEKILERVSQLEKILELQVSKLDKIKNDIPTLIQESRIEIEQKFKDIINLMSLNYKGSVTNYRNF